VRAALTVLGALACLALVACGGGSGTSDQGLGLTQQDGLGGVPLHQLTCAEWNGAGAADRASVVAQLAGLRGDQVTGRGYRGQGSVLDSELAYRMLDGRCDHPGSEAFVLYKLYAFAADFAGGPPG
jgi:hypothetical protein